MEMTKRNPTFDIAKGIAIILMVLGHCYSAENYILHLIYAFHMPFFFIVSGALYANKWQSEIKFHAFQTSKKLLIPYFIFDTLFLLFTTILGRPANIAGAFFTSFVRMVIPFSGATVTWFLPCLLITLLIFVPVAKYVPKKSVRIIIYAVLFLGGLLIQPNSLFIPLWRGLLGVGFFAAGFYGRSFLTRKASALHLLCSGIVFLCLAYINGQVSMVTLSFANPILYTVNGLLGTFVLLQICIRIPRNKWSAKLACFGRDSVIVLCTHMFLVEIIRLLEYKLFDNILHTLGLFEGLVFGAMVLCAMYLIVPICNRYFKVLFGK